MSQFEFIFKTLLFFFFKFKNITSFVATKKPEDLLIGKLGRKKIWFWKFKTYFGIYFPTKQETEEKKNESNLKLHKKEKKW